MPRYSPWDELHIRGDVPHHAQRIHYATAGELADRGDEPPELEQLRWARWVQIEAAQLVEAAIIEAKDAGASWDTIGAIFGVTRQAAHERWSPIVNDRP